MTKKINMVAIDLAKGRFQVCAVGANGAVLYNRALSRTRMAALLAAQPPCVVAMEACATSHHRGRVVQQHGHEVRVVPAAYVEPFVKRQKNDRADAEAIAEAVSRPTMRFVAVNSVETQGRAVAFRTHQCLVRQRTQLINAPRRHLAGFGLVAPKGPASMKGIENALADETSESPCPVRDMGAIYLGQTDIRRLLIVGAMGVIRWVVRKGSSPNRWLAALVARKPRMVAAVALANKMARIIWAVTTKQEDYRMA